MWRYLSWAGICSALVLGTSSIHADDVAAGSDRKNDSVAAIVNMWKDRGDGIKSIVIEWTYSEMKARGSLSGPARTSKLFPKDAVVPAEDHLSNGNGKFMVEWPRMRYETTQDFLSATEQGFVKRQYTTSFDGSTYTTLREPEGGKAQVNIFPQAEGLRDLDNIRIRPLLLALWPANTDVSRISTDKLVRFEGTEPIGKDECIRLALDTSNERRELYWVSPAKDHRIVRYRSERRGNLLGQYDIEYALDDVWLPIRWRITSHRSSDGSVAYEINGQVTSRSINKKIGKEAFDVVPPKDAIISHEDPPAPPPLPKPPKPAQ